MPRKKAIPDEVRAQVQARVDAFNHAVIRDPRWFFEVRFHDKHAYLDRRSYRRISRRARMIYTGDMERWGLAIWRHDDEDYDPYGPAFPNLEYVDATTIEDALHKAMDAYPWANEEQRAEEQRAAECCTERS